MVVLKLRYSSTPFSKKFPSMAGFSSPLDVFRWLVPVLDPGFIFQIMILMLERPAKRFRITGKRSALRRERGSGEGLPTPKRWKRLVPQGTGAYGDRGIVCLPFLFPRTGVG